KEPTALASLDADFHTAVAQAGGNKLFAALLAQMRGALARQSETLTVIARRRDDSNREHQLIVDAIVEGSVERAQEAMAVHLDAVSTSISGLKKAPPGPTRQTVGNGTPELRVVTTAA
ncbi:MAG: FCD domain-containing protein, partial [Nakamurella sp.]